MLLDISVEVGRADILAWSFFFFFLRENGGRAEGERKTECVSEQRRGRGRERQRQKERERERILQIPWPAWSQAWDSIP